MKFSIVFRDEFVISLSFDVFESRKKCRETERILDKREAPASKDTARSDFAELTSAVFPHGLILTVEYLAGSETD